MSKMMKIKKSNSFDLSTSEDTSGCKQMEGLMTKKNSSGIWKDRYAALRNEIFLTLKPKNKKPTKEVKEHINVNTISTVDSNSGSLNIVLNSGETLTFKSTENDEWVSAIKSRMNWVNGTESPSIGAMNTSSSKQLSGWLLKKSHNKYQGFQDRYVKFDGTVLRYFKREGDTKESGSANMTTAEFVRAFDNTSDCKIFELHDSNRVFVFQAKSHEEMLQWVSTLEKVRNQILEKIQLEKEAKLASETPSYIRLYDEQGVNACNTYFKKELQELYPYHDEMTVSEHIAHANHCLSVLNAVVPEIQSPVLKATRYDVLAVVLTELNNLLSSRIADLFETSEEEDDEGVKSSSLHSSLENASLGELHSLIVWISKYQITLRTVKCPVTVGEQVSTATTKLSTTHLAPKACPLFDLLPKVCELYAYGGSAGSKGGAASHLYEHCNKVWESVLSNPEEMLQQHQNGSFYTHAPIAMWEAINQHIELATSTECPILHVMIADKVVSSLNDVIHNITKYVKGLEVGSPPELKEIELEFLSALANDTALHIEEVIELIENFAIPEIRERIDNIFDVLTTSLVDCGQACLKRLAGLVMNDVQTLLNEVFTSEWVEGNQVKVAIATISDYMSDFEAFLSEFWADKFIYTILEEVILCYTRTILFSSSGGSMWQALKNSAGSPSLEQCPVNPETLGRLAQDVNALNAFFGKKAGQEVATEFLELINEVSLLLFLDPQSMVVHIGSRMKEFPSAAPAIKEVMEAVFRLRQDLTKRQLDEVLSQINPLLLTASEAARENEAQNIAEGRLGLLLFDVIPAELKNKSTGANRQSLRKKYFANIPLLGGESQVKHDAPTLSNERVSTAEDEGVSLLSRSSSQDLSKLNSSKALLGEVMEVLNQQEEEEQAILRAEEQERRELEERRGKVGVLRYDGYLEKKSPAHNLWQRRFFKLTTRETNDPLNPYSYSLLWYKKEGGSVLKAIDVSKIRSISMVESPRPIAYKPDTRDIVLQSTISSEGTVLVECCPVAGAVHSQPTISGPAVTYFSFMLTQFDGKEHILRGAKVDRVLKWMYLISLAAHLAYDAIDKTWNREAYELYQERLQEQASQPSFLSAVSSENNKHMINTADATALINAAREEMKEKEKMNKPRESEDQMKKDQELAAEGERLRELLKSTESSTNDDKMSLSPKELVSEPLKERKSFENPLLAAKETTNPLHAAKDKDRENSHINRSSIASAPGVTKDSMGNGSSASTPPTESDRESTSTGSAKLRRVSFAENVKKENNQKSMSIDSGSGVNGKPAKCCCVLS